MDVVHAVAAVPEVSQTTTSTLENAYPNCLRTFLRFLSSDPSETNHTLRGVILISVLLEPDINAVRADRINQLHIGAEVSERWFTTC